MKQIRGKIVLITGGASGLGKAFARAFKAEGALVALTDLKGRPLRDAAKELGASAFEMDVLDIASVKRCRSQVRKELGLIDILINNAGVVYGGEFGSTPLEKHILTYRVNTLGPLAVTHCFYEDLKSRPEAHIVFVASASGYIGLPFGSSYASSKWAVIGLGESLRAEVSETKSAHLSTTIVCPSYVDTGMFEGAKAPLLTPMLTADRVALALVRAVQSRKAYVNLPFMVNFIQTLRGFLPLFLFDWLMRITHVSGSMAHWKGRVSKAASSRT